jgi:phosphoglycolate phosphatase-like HAD superfamily hydrolase
MPETLPRPAIIIFDVDGTLVNVTASYRETAPAAAGRYLRLLGLEPPPLTGEVYDIFKRMGGFNDDWDLTAGLLRVLLSDLPPARPLPDQPWTDQPALIAALQVAAAPLAGMTPAAPDWERLIAQVQAAGGGLAGLAQVISPRNRCLVWRTADAATDDLVQRIFEELYLGGKLFEQDYGLPARFHAGPGLIEHEQLHISLDTLERLGRRARLGIATGRTHFELAYPLARLGLASFFDAAATMTDALLAQAPGQASLLKPHPYLLHRAADALDPSGQLVAAYVGDVADDVIAARRADGTRRWLAVALATTAAQRERYLALGAHMVLSHPDELLAAWGRATDRRLALADLTRQGSQR